MREVRFDDIETLRSLISETYGPWGAEVEVTQAMINAYADLTGDHQWIHVDVERARRDGPFGTTIAHGFLTLGLLGKVRPPSSFTAIGHGSVLNYGSDGLRFLAPVPSGSKIHAHQRLMDVRVKDNGTLLVSEMAVHVVGNEKPSLIYKGMVLYSPPKPRA
jgi:acyl dehydratase